MGNPGAVAEGHNRPGKDGSVFGQSGQVHGAVSNGVRWKPASKGSYPSGPDPALPSLTEPWGPAPTTFTEPLARQDVGTADDYATAGTPGGRLWAGVSPCYLGTGLAR
jgi:hypothetical protein